MKKTRMIVLALAVAISLMGAGYAAWTQDVVVSGTVNTGNMVVTIDRLTDQNGNAVDYDAITYYYDVNSKEYKPFSDDVGIPSYPGYSKENFKLEDYYEFITTKNKKSIKFKYNNFFPGLQAFQYYTIKNEGTVPVKIANISFSKNFNKELSNHLKILTSINQHEDTSLMKDLIDNTQNLANKYKDIEILPGEEATLTFGAELDINAPNTLQNKTTNNTFTCTFNFIQSNAAQNQ